jgi:LysM repeat protein
MIRIWITLSLLCILGHASAQDIFTTRQYISQYKEVAEAEMRRTGVPAAISLAQGIVESNSGNGWLARNSNNHFGIKCKGGWNGQTVAYTDDARDECFRKYDNPVESWHDHSDFLRSSPRYSFLFTLSPQDYTDWAYGLKKAGYATSPAYARKLIQTISDYNLEQYTLEAMGAPVNDTSIQKLQFIGDDQAVPDQNNAPVIHDYPTGVFKVNGRKVVFLSKGASLLPLAEQYSIKLRDLVSYNDLENDQPLSQDMLIFLEKKAQFGPEAFHVVQPGEDIHDISQQEGIQEKWLLRRNKLAKGDEPIAGEKLYLTGFALYPPHLMPPPVAQNPVPAVHQPSLTQIADQIKSGIRNILNRDQSQTSTAPMQAEPDLSSQDNTASAETPGKNSYPVSRRQWPDTAMSQSIPPTDTNTPQSSSTVLINRDNPSPHRTWPVAHLKTKPEAHNFTRNGYLYHIVQPGETLSVISSRYGTPVSELKQWNHVTASGLMAGQRLIIGRAGE